jgi:hypothetical protein
MFISKLVHLTITVPCQLKRVARVVPVLNGRDSDGKPRYLGAETTKILRYLLVLCVAKSSPTFSLSATGVKEMDNSFYFTPYMLSKLAKSFRDISPWHLPITYDRGKVAIKIYNMISKNNDVAPYSGVTIKKIDGDTYVTTTKKGDDISEQLLEDLMAYMENYSDDRFVAKGGTKYNAELQEEEKRRLVEKISAINLSFKDELKTIEDDIDEGEADGDDDEKQTELKQ